MAKITPGQPLIFFKYNENDASQVMDQYGTGGAEGQHHMNLEDDTLSHTGDKAATMDKYVGPWSRVAATDQDNCGTQGGDISSAAAGDFTIAMWIKSALANGDATYWVFAEWAYWDAGIPGISGDWWMLHWNNGANKYPAASTNNHLVFCINENGTDYYVESADAYDLGNGGADGNWHLVIAGRDGSDLFLVIDNVAKQTNAATSNSLANSNATLQLGGSIFAGYDWPGYISNFALWNKAVSSNEIEYIWNDGDGTEDYSSSGAGQPFRPIYRGVMKGMI